MSDASRDPPNPPPLSKIRLGSILVGETLLLAFTSAAAYAIAFSYEVGYADHFGYPVWLIQVDFRAALLIWGALFVVALAVGQFLVSLTWDLSPMVTSILGRQLSFIGPPLLTVAVFLYIGVDELGWTMWLSVVLFSLIALARLFTLVIRPLWSKGPYQGRPIERWEQALQRSEKHDPSGFFPRHLLRVSPILWPE
jgi:hypothetical protein